MLPRRCGTSRVRCPSVDFCVSRFGRLDLLVNNAAILHRAPLELALLADWDRVVAVNQTGPFLGIRAVAARLLAAAALLVWGWFAVATLTAPVLPSALPPPVERTLVAVVLVGGAVLGSLVVLTGARRVTADGGE